MSCGKTSTEVSVASVLLTAVGQVITDGHSNLDLGILQCLTVLSFTPRYSYLREMKDLNVPIAMKKSVTFVRNERN
jgi:hypothetical protein